MLLSNNTQWSWELPTLRQQFNTTWKRTETINVHKANMSVYNSKKANLHASRKERVKVPTYDGGYHISEFLTHPFGIEAVLNKGALQSFQSLGDNMYRCFLPKLQLLNFEASPVIDLRVTPSSDDCVVELLSCKFQGSEIVERQNEKFSAFMINHMTWDTYDSEVLLKVDAKLSLTIEIYTRPFTLLPTSAVERPGNLMMQALMDKLVPMFVEQLLQDYSRWVNQQHENLT